MEISFGDNVRVKATPETTAIGVASRVGPVWGITTPSSISVQVIGDLKEDIAIHVWFEDIEDELWFSEDLLEFVDHGEGTQFIIGNVKAVRRQDGTWDETRISQQSKKK